MLRSATPTKTKVFARSAPRPSLGAAIIVNIVAAPALSRSRRLTASSPQARKPRENFTAQRGATRRAAQAVLSVDNRSADKQPTKDCLFLLFLAKPTPRASLDQGLLRGVCHERTGLNTTVRNCTRDEGGPFEAGSQVQVSSHRELLSSRAMVVSVAETPGPDPGRQGGERRAQATR